MRVLRCIERLGAKFRRSASKTPEATIEFRTEAEEEALVLLAGLTGPSYQAPRPRAATVDEVTVAAWANLAVEEPDLTLNEARRLLATT